MQTAAGPAGVFQAGSEYEVPDGLGAAFVAAHAAVRVGGAGHSAPAPPVVESAAVAPPELAVRGRPRKRVAPVEGRVET